MDPRRVGFVWQDVDETTTPKSSDIHINRNKGKSTNEANDELTWNYCRPSAHHPNNVIVGFAGGNVRPVNEGISYLTWIHLMTPDGENAKIGPANAPTPLARQIGIYAQPFDEKDLY